MISESELLFQLGAIMLLAFIAATLARRLNQTVMIGYIIIGIFIGPKMSLSLFGQHYNGLITDTTIVDLLSNVGLIMLMFFVGLEFSFTKLKKVRTPAIILAVIDTSVGLFTGFVFASILGWPLIDSLFLAGVIAMSSTSIAMKVLFDLKRMSSPEVEFLIGLVVVETFIAMLILAIASGMIVNPGAGPMSYGRLLIGIGAFYAFFVWVAIWAVPRVVAFFDKIDNDELFVLFALGIVFLTAGMASLMNVPPIIGAFFIGMVLAESKVTGRVQARLESFKDAFVAIFFTAFGMMIDPSMFKSILWMVLLAVPMVIVYEAFVMSSISLFLGFSPRASTTIGTSMCGRGVEAILYSSVGSKVKGATMGSLLNPFTGAFCFVMSALTPFLVKHSAKLSDGFSRILPKSIKFSGSVVSRTLGRAVLPSEFNPAKKARATAALLLSFVLVCFAILVSSSTVHIGFIIAGAAISVGILISTRSEISVIIQHIDFSNLGIKNQRKGPVVTLVSGIAFGAAAFTLAIAVLWGVMWPLAVALAAGYVLFVLCIMRWAYGALYVEGSDVPQKVYRLSARVEDAVQETVTPGIPSPVYSIVQRPLVDDVPRARSMVGDDELLPLEIDSDMRT